MFEFSVSRFGKEYEINCYDSKQNTMFLLFSSRNYPLIHRMYDALCAADNDQIMEILHGWSGRITMNELKRIETILNKKQNLYYEPNSRRILNESDLYMSYKRKRIGMLYSKYVEERLKCRNLLRNIQLVPEGVNVPYAAAFV